MSWIERRHVHGAPSMPTSTIAQVPPYGAGEPIVTISSLEIGSQKWIRGVTSYYQVTEVRYRGQAQLPLANWTKSTFCPNADGSLRRCGLRQHFNICVRYSPAAATSQQSMSKSAPRPGVQRRTHPHLRCRTQRALKTMPPRSTSSGAINGRLRRRLNRVSPQVGIDEEDPRELPAADECRRP